MLMAATIAPSAPQGVGDLPYFEPRLEPATRRSSGLSQRDVMRSIERFGTEVAPAVRAATAAQAPKR
jgi:hypothetical protein